jgi:tripartite-type tricarboxylate transporter receptor subunit TctC
MTQAKPGRFTSLVIVIAALSMFWWISPVDAQTVQSFYAGKTITLLAGSSAGGGTDVTARLIARHMERYVPGKPTVVVNKPGAGGMIAVNELYNLRKPDGLTLSTINSGAIFAVAGGNEAIRFDLKKFLWVGQALDEAQIVYVRSATLTPRSKRLRRQIRKASSRRWAPKPSITPAVLSSKSWSTFSASISR